MDWKRIQESIEKVIESNNQDNTIKTRIDLPGVTIYNMPRQDVVRVDIKARS
jgi:hypothetical protein